MLPDVHQHAISVCVLEHTYSAFVMFAAPQWLIHSGRACIRTASLGTMIDGNLETRLSTSLPLAGSGMGIILCHSGSVVKVEGLTSTVAGDFSEEKVTPAMDT